MSLNREANMGSTEDGRPLFNPVESVGKIATPDFIEVMPVEEVTLGVRKEYTDHSGNGHPQKLGFHLTDDTL